MDIQYIPSYHSLFVSGLGVLKLESRARFAGVGIVSKRETFYNEICAVN